MSTILQDARLPAHLLELELTESHLMDNPAAAQAQVTALQRDLLCTESGVLQRIDAGKTFMEQRLDPNKTSMEQRLDDVIVDAKLEFADKKRFSQHIIGNIFEDRFKQLWITTITNGVYYISNKHIRN